MPGWLQRLGKNAFRDHDLHIQSVSERYAGAGVRVPAGCARQSGASMYRPSAGPKASHGSSAASGREWALRTNSSMLTTVIAKPMQLAKVSTLPTISGGAFC